MKKIILLLFLFYSTVSFSQTICPAHVPQLTFYITKPLVLNKVVGSAGSCDPEGDVLSWSIDESTFPTFPYKIQLDVANPGRIFIAVNDVNNANNTAKTYIMTLRLTDGKPNSFNTTTVNIIDINNPPVINAQTFSINENVINGTIVGTVLATDPDVNQTKQFSIVSGNVGNAFTINSTSGLITVSNVINYELVKQYSLIVKVQDNGTDNLSAQNTITININNVNEPPVIYEQTFGN